MQIQPNSQNWYELDFPSSEDESSSPSTSTKSFAIKENFPLFLFDPLVPVLLYSLGFTYFKS